MKVGIAVVGLFVTMLPPVVAQEPRLDAVMRLSSVCVGDVLDALSNSLVEERATQELGPAAYAYGNATARTRRVVLSDLLLLQVGGPLEWRQVRDAYEVDGVPVENREGRLTSLLSGEDGNEKAAKLAADSARFNLGPAGRTVNTPILPVLFLQQAIRTRFAFRVVGSEGAALGRQLIVQYSETSRPTLIRGLQRDQDIDLPASGRFWIEEPSGCVRKAELRLAYRRTISLSTTVFERGHGLAFPVPVSMADTYDFQYRTASAPAVYRVSTLSTYGNVRTFSTHTDTTVLTPQ